jgi:hypothetical protein
MDAEVSTHTFLTMIIEESVCFMSCGPILFLQLFLCGTHEIYKYFFINWTLRMSDNLPERVQILCHAHIICITVLENKIICCQRFCDLPLKSTFERIFNVMQLILIKIKWHIKWKYWIQKFHDLCLSYYFKDSQQFQYQPKEKSLLTLTEHITLKIQLLDWDRLKHVAVLYRLIGSQPFPLHHWISNRNIHIYIRLKTQSTINLTGCWIVTV